MAKKKTTTTKEKRDIHAEITANVIAVMESTGANWIKEWTGSGLPSNPFTKASYSGINVLQLAAVAHLKGYSQQKWGTYKQISEKGGQVKKGEKGTPVVFYKTLKIEETKTDKEKMIPLMRNFTVFNIEQVDGLDEKYFEAAEKFENDSIEEIESFIKKTKAKIGTGQPSYSPGLDIIKMPALEEFTTAEAYYSTLFHELGHWTMHKKRLDRDASNYAFEELVAELCAVFTSADFRISAPIENHACYLKSWLKVLRSDNTAIFKAASQASKANKFLIELAS